MGIRRVVVGVAAAVALVLSAVLLIVRSTDGGGGEQGLVTLLTDCVHPVERPAVVIFACGDGNFYAEGLEWSSWGSESASGSGTAEVNDCKPSCADGKFHTYPIALTATSKQECSAGDQRYTLVNYSFTGENPFPPEAQSQARGSVDYPCGGSP